ncbi:unnamed protein product, partial [Brachionus calyciflorus]
EQISLIKFDINCAPCSESGISGAECRETISSCPDSSTIKAVYNLDVLQNLSNPSEAKRHIQFLVNFYGVDDEDVSGNFYLVFDKYKYFANWILKIEKIENLLNDEFSNLRPVDSDNEEEFDFILSDIKKSRYKFNFFDLSEMYKILSKERMENSFPNTTVRLRTTTTNTITQTNQVNQHDAMQNQ